MNKVVKMTSFVKPRPSILITNDDGIEAPGISHLYNAVSTCCDAVVVAPSVEQSATSLSITTREPLMLKQMGDRSSWTVTGTPADCVKLGLSVVMKDALPDLILSGINSSSNSGRNVLYSGTCGAVIEGVLHGIPGMALSCYDASSYSMAEEFIPRLIEYVRTHPLALGSFLNINFPSIKEQEFKGLKMVRQGREFWTESPTKHSQAHYMLGGRLATFDEDDSDVHWLKKGYITVVPIHISELTDHRHLDQHKAHFEEYFRGNS